MKKRLHSISFLVLLILVCAACTRGTTEENDGGLVQEEQTASSAAAVERPVERETKNVTYQGTVRPAGISIYQQGSHRLELSDGRFILLESTAVDINGYVGEEAEVFGALRPTVEEGAMIMRVERISLVNEEEESESDENSADEEDAEDEEETDNTEGAEDLGDEEEIDDAAEDTEESEDAEEEEAQSPTPSEEVLPEKPIDDVETTTVPLTVPADHEPLIQAMAGEDLQAERWTQTYCTTHIGFCIPVHKNWWYKSFGTTTSHLWHVEISSAEVESLGQGPLVVKLVAGAIGSRKAADGQIRIESGYAVGYRAWDDSRHFEVMADERLEDAVRYITAQLREFEG